MLKQRIITAIILIPIFLATLYYLPAREFSLLMAGITLLGAWEWTNLMSLKKLSSRFLYLFILIFVLVDLLFIPVTFIFVVSFLWWIVALILLISYPKFNIWSKSVFLTGLMGLFVLAPCWAALSLIREQKEGFLALLFLFILIWSADSAAYFVGRMCGTKKLAPLISPGKSWQGLGGAMLATVMIALVTAWLGKIPLSVWPFAVLLSVITVLFSVVGDLFESMMKRNVGLKDSGTLLPGHGGLLDRIDSLTSAAPIFVLGSLLLGKYF